MLLKKKDLTERIHKERLFEKIKSEERNIDLLIKWSQLTKQPLAWRATWLLKQTLNKNDTIIKEITPNVLKQFTLFNESQKREWLKILEKQELSDHEEGILFDLCMTEWGKVHNHPALRASAIVVIFKILKKYPELKSELNHVMSTEYTESLSPGIQRSILKSWTSF